MKIELVTHSNYDDDTHHQWCMLFAAVMLMFMHGKHILLADVPNRLTTPKGSSFC